MSKSAEAAARKKQGRRRRWRVAYAKIYGCTGCPYNNVNRTMVNGDLRFRFVCMCGLNSRTLTKREVKEMDFPKWCPLKKEWE